MGSKPSSSSTSTYSPPADVLAQYNAVTAKANQVAATPYSAYSGELVAPVNSQQTTGINAVNSASGIQNGYNAGATGLAAASASTIDPTQYSAAQLQQYESPYNTDVVNSTLATINNQNQQQAQQLQGNAISSGAFGGDRAGVAQAALAGQQDLATNQTIAGLNNQNFQNAQSEFNAQQSTNLSAAQNNASRQLAASQQLGNLGTTAQTEALNEANAQTNAGTLQQTTQQNQDTAAYNQYLQQQAYPFQTTGWLANIVEGIGSQSGGTSTSQTDSSVGSSILGGLVGLGGVLKLRKGGRVPHMAGGGGLGGLGGGVLDQGIYNPTVPAALQGLGGGQIVPQSNLQVGHTMPSGNTVGQQQQAQSPQAMGQNIASTAKGIQGLGNAFTNSSLGDSLSDAWQDAGSGMSDAAFGLARGGRTGLAGFLYANGGGVMGDGGLMRRPHYDDGGAISPDALLYDPGALGLGAAALAAGPAIAPTTAALGLVPPVASAPPASDSGPSPQTDGDIKKQQLNLLMKGLSNNATAASDAGDPLPTFATGSVPALSTPTDPAAYAPTAPAPGLGPTPTGGLASPAATDNAPVQAAVPLSSTVTGLVPPGAAPSGGLVPSPAYSTPDASLPRGLRNNNPGNLVDNSWTQSLPGYAGSDGKFAIFETPAAGNAALDRNLQGYASQGISTPLQITSKWAPASDGNDPASYASVIGKTLGVGINDAVDLANPAIRAKVAGAITQVENGTNGNPALAGLGKSSAPSDASAYDDQGNPITGALGAIGNALKGLGGGSSAVPAGNTGLAPIDNAIGATTPSGSGHFGISDSERLGLIAAGLGMMAGKSMNPWQNIGEGGLQGLQTMMSAAKQNAEIANYGADAQSRRAQAQNLNSETQYRPADVGIRQQNANTETMRAQIQRYSLLPGPNGDFRYIDNFNPGRGILSADQIANGASIVPSATISSANIPALTSSSSSGPATDATPSSGGTRQQPTSQLDSSRFMTTGNPTLQVPANYLPTNYYQNQLRIQRDPVAKATLEKQTVDDVTGANTRAQKAYNSTFYADEMDKNAAALPNSGVLAPGAMFPERLNLAKNWNLAMGGLGMDGLQVDPDAVKSGESLIKDKTRLGAQLTTTLGSREAASVFTSMMSAVPGGDNTRAGYKSISSSLRALGQREIDHSAFMQDYAAQYGNTSGAEEAFNQLNPPMQYARQAQAMATVPQASIDLLRANVNNPRAIAAFESKYGAGLSRYYTGQFAK